MLISAIVYLEDQSREWRNASAYGQEKFHSKFTLPPQCLMLKRYI